jgi:hypothetical protein
MVRLHDTLGSALLVASIAFTVCAGLLAFAGGPVRALGPAWKVVVAGVALQGLIGGALLVSDERPTEGLHLLYGVLALLVLPAAAAFSSEAPPRARAAVLAFAGLVTTGVLMRSLGTG